MRFFNRNKNKRISNHEAPGDLSDDMLPGLPRFRVTPAMVVPPPARHLTSPDIPKFDPSSNLGYMFETVLTHFNPDHLRNKFERQWKDDPSDMVSYVSWKREEEEANPNQQATPIDEVPLTRLPSETHDAYGEYLALLMALQPQSDTPKFSNIEKAKCIAQDTGLDKALEGIPRRIIEDTLSVECTHEWGDGWEVLEPHLNNNDWEAPYRSMMDWTAGAGVATGQIIKNSRKVMPAFERLTQLLYRLQSAKDSGELDAANRGKKQQMANQFGILAKPYDPANIWFDDP